jgi:transposase
MSPLEVKPEQLAELDKPALIELILTLQRAVSAQAAELQALRDQVAKNSRNSGKPPSSDGLKKPRTRSQRKKSGKRSGGQPGHTGHTLAMSDTPDHIQVHSVTTCPDCATDLGNVAPGQPERRQVFDIPPVTLEVTEHQAEVKVCPQCQRVVKGAFPVDVTQAVQYGPRWLAQVSYLNSYQLLPWARTCEVRGDFYGHTPAEAIVKAANRAVAEQVAPSIEVLKKQLIAAEVLHLDESGLRVEGQLNWLHVASTPQLTYYYVHPKRGQEAMNAMQILPEFMGYAVHDHWQSYFKFTTCQHVLCNAHHLRQLQFVVDQYEQSWAEEMMQLLVDIKAEVAAAPPERPALPPTRLAHFEQRFDELISQGLAANPPPVNPPPKKRGRRKQSPPKNLLDRLRDYKPQVLACNQSLPPMKQQGAAGKRVRVTGQEYNSG